MARTVKKRRGGEKKKTLFSTSYVTYSLADKEEQQEARKALTATFNNMNLKAYLARYEKIAKAILKEHNLPTTWRNISKYTNNYEIPIHASYAADILFSIHQVRRFIKKGDAANAALEAIRLGGYIACNDAELAAGSRESKRTANARKKKATKPEERRELMRAIAEEKFNWREGKHLTPAQRREVNTELLKKYKAIDRPTSQDMSNDALILGLRSKGGY